jgi:hypothetical protein
VQHSSLLIILHSLLDLVFDVDSDETLHVLVLAVALVLVGVELLAEEDEPVLLNDAALLLLLKDLTLDVDRVLTLTRLTRLLGRRDTREATRTILLLHFLCLHSLQG